LKGVRREAIATLEPQRAGLVIHAIGWTKAAGRKRLDEDGWPVAGKQHWFPIAEIQACGFLLLCAWRGIGASADDQRHFLKTGYRT
tara:strand:- start:30023 stop:30280 length:258 start_codon:yes stop_codon:yes gene_type:complete